MEFFERAHIVKGTSSRKESKSDENVKKQLKQMLYGYKHSDIELIKSSAIMKNDYDDSTSVSGFSDLNLTNSSIEGDILHEPLSPNHNDLSSLDVNEVRLTKSPNNLDIENEDNQNDSLSVTIESISEYTDDVQSLSENISCEAHGNSSTGEYDADDTLSENESDQYEPFDADGALAAKILKRLSKTEMAAKNRNIKDSNKVHKEISKTKFNDDLKYKGPYKPKDVSDMDIVMEEIENLGPMGPVKLAKSKVYKGPLIPKDSSEEISESENNVSEHNSAIDSDESSPKRKVYRGPLIPKDSSKKISESEDNVSEHNSAIDSDESSPKRKVYRGPLIPKDSSKKISESEDDVSEHNSAIDSDESSPKRKVHKGPLIPKGLSEEISESENDVSEHNSAIDSDESSPFVSVMVTDMLSQSLDDILGEYKHSTMKNLPSDSHNADFSTENTGLEDTNVTDIEMEEDVDSLIPEVDDVAVGDIIDLETTLDTSTPPNNDSTAYDDSLPSEQASEREPSTESIDTTLINPVKVYIGKTNCIFVLKHPAEMYIHGKVKVKSLGGTVEVLGYILQDKTYEMYAPNYNYAQYLRTVENQNAYYGLFGKLTAAGLTVSEAEEIVVTLGELDGVISMQPLQSRKLDFVESNFSVTDIFSKTKQVDDCLRMASELLGCSLYLSKPWKCFHENAVWRSAISCGFDGPSRGVVCGGKGSGKSTFLRYYVNRLLAQGPVLVVDLDPGQCEFTPAGNVSASVVADPLLGPNFTHLRTPEIMLNIGSINTMDNPRRYANAVRALVDHCSNDSRLAAMPWIVNTMGMTTTVGLKLISLAILLTKPTFVLQINSKNAKKDFGSHLDQHFIKQQYFERYQNDVMFRNIGEVDDLEYLFFMSHHMENSWKNNLSLAPRDERYLNLLAYFGELMNLHRCDLLGIVPYEVNLRDLSVGTAARVGAPALKAVLNGKVVALCELGERSHGQLFALADQPLRCRGYGLIRGIDWEKGVLYVITPAELARVNALVYADWMPELRGQEARLPPGTRVPYRTAAQYQQRELMFAPRRRFNPLQLLKISRNP